MSVSRPRTADRALHHLPLRLRPVRPADPDPEVPVAAEAQELSVPQQPPARAPSSVVITAFVWSNRSSDGTPPK